METHYYVTFVYIQIARISRSFIKILESTTRLVELSLKRPLNSFRQLTR